MGVWVRVYQGDGLGQTFQLQSEHLRLLELSRERQELFGTVPVLPVWAQNLRPLLERHEKHPGPIYTENQSSGSLSLVFKPSNTHVFG